MNDSKNGSGVVLFLVLTVAFSAIFWTLIIAAGHVGAGGGHYVEALMWSPATAAFTTVFLRRFNFNTLGLGWGQGRYIWLGYLTPLAYAAVAYALIWTLGFGHFPNLVAISALAKRLDWSITAPELFVPLYFIFIGTIGMISSTAHALGEEIGWRGFLAPRLVQKWGFTAGAVVTGLIWTIWHVPILLFADYNAGTEWWFALPCFAVMVVSLSVILTWLRLRSKSVWPCAILHASHNLFIQAVFTPLTAPKGPITAYAVGEFGFAVPATVVIFAVIYWARRGFTSQPSVAAVG